MDSLDLIQTFREVARRGSFSAAARALDMSPANASKYVAALEARFGVRLFNRTTRKVSLTDAGQLLYERSGPLLELVQMTAGDLRERATRPSGRLVLAAPHGLVQVGLAEMLARFLARYPDVSLSLQLSDRMVDLAEDGVDLALRAGPIGNQNLIVRRLMPLERVVVASPGYWAARGKPRHPGELLTGHELLSVAAAGVAPRWIFVERGKTIELHPQVRVDATSYAPLATLALHGVGATYTARRIVLEHLRGGALESVLDEFMPNADWVYAAYAHRRHNSAALTALLAFLEAEMASPPDLAATAPPAGGGRS
ncbi:LysR family transcriptional regulator [Ottowia sp.]|jgi:DNA-binding transcriptional LysR family regulator|uniref:LysR family transcriptional regulator n=1 Tax=Ottowia sp. TaxID=1898956 RepID=UPI0025FCEDF8|nr:LysR family transcriptional regulator [Ottowia sp.]MBK6615372.1 LysR family transcriptional regulator [Ottowia sp.]MBK6746444.1 LysR family transcriptional regulator [Ottowia sp.]